MSVHSGLLSSACQGRAVLCVRPAVNAISVFRQGFVGPLPKTGFQELRITYVEHEQQEQNIPVNVGLHLSLKRALDVRCAHKLQHRWWREAKFQLCIGLTLPVLRLQYKCGGRRSARRRYPCTHAYTVSKQAIACLSKCVHMPLKHLPQALVCLVQSRNLQELATHFNKRED